MCSCLMQWEAWKAGCVPIFIAARSYTWQWKTLASGHYTANNSSIDMLLGCVKRYVGCIPCGVRHVGHSTHLSHAAPPTLLFIPMLSGCAVSILTATYTVQIYLLWLSIDLALGVWFPAGDSMGSGKWWHKLVTQSTNLPEHHGMYSGWLVRAMITTVWATVATLLF